MIVEQTGQEKEVADNKGKRGENKESHSLHSRGYQLRLRSIVQPFDHRTVPLILIVLRRQKWTNIIKLPGRMYCTTTTTRGILKGKN